MMHKSVLNTKSFVYMKIPKGKKEKILSNFHKLIPMFQSPCI